MEQFRLKSYNIKTEKLKERRVRLHFLSDLHGLSFPEEEQAILMAIHKRTPDVVIVGGDMVVSRKPESIKEVLPLIKELSFHYPVYYALGNHEQKLFGHWEGKDSLRGSLYHRFLEEHVILLDNSRALCRIKGEVLELSGLSLERMYYRKPFPQKLSKSHLEALVGIPESNDAFQILLAHNPFHGNTYFSGECDLVLSGHYHGGLLRFGENHGLLSTHFHLFPKYCCGSFKKGRKQLIVSGGMGEHSLQPRICNPREIIELDILPLK